MTDPPVPQTTPPGEPTPRLSAVIPAFNGGDVLARCVISLRQHHADIDIVVVDNASSDDTAAVCLGLGVRLIRNKDNHGFGAACNQGIAASTAEYALLVNQDAFVLSDLEPALALMDAQPEIAALGGRMQGASGQYRKSAMRFPSFRTLLLKRLSYRQGEPFASGSFSRRPVQVDYFEFSLALLRREPFKRVSGFDESYFMYGEERDLAYRFKQAGYSIAISGLMRYEHAGGYSSAREALVVSGQRRFIRTHLQSPTRQLFSWTLVAKQVLRVASTLWSRILGRSDGELLHDRTKALRASLGWGPR